MKKLLVLGLSLLVMGVVAARAAETKELWDKNCKKCHGEDGAGKTTMGKKLGIKDYTDPKVQEKLKDEEMTKAIKEGVKKGDETRMKAFGDVLSDKEIKDLIQYVRKLKK